MRANILLPLVLVPLLFLGACDGGSSSNGDNNVSETPVNPPVEPPVTPPGEVLTGSLLDAAVSGVAYETPTLKGVTGVDGSFRYREGEAVNFKLGDTLLGRVMGQAEVTPFDLAGAEAFTGIDIYSALNNEYDLSFHAVINIIVLLQSLDRDADPNNGIEISPDMSALLLGVKLDVIENWATFQREAALLHALAEANMRGLFDTPHEVAKPGPALQHLYASMRVNPRTVRTIAEENVSGSVDPTQHWLYTSDNVLEQFKLVREDGSLKTQASYKFNANGNLTEEAVDANGDGVSDYSLVYEYNSHGDPTLKAGDEDFCDGSLASPRTWEYHYDSHDKTISQSEVCGNGVWITMDEYEYDARGNLTYHKWTCNEAAYDGNCFEFDVGEAWRIEDRISKYEYDARGNRIRETIDVTADGTEDEVNVYEYDAMGNLTWDGNEGVSYEYDTNGNVVHSERDYDGDGVADEYSTTEYDDIGRVVADEDQDSTFKYEYDANGNLTKTEEDVDKDGTLDHIQTWIYDTDNRLIRIDHDNLGVASDSVETFEYDGGKLIRHVHRQQGVDYQQPPSKRIWSYEYGADEYLIREQYVFDFLGDAACPTCPNLVTTNTKHYEAGTWQNVLTPLPDAPPPIIGDRPITDTVTADGKVWAQVDLFTNLPWNDINAVCPEGACSGTLNGYDMTGWTWATVDDLNALFNHYVGSDELGPGPDCYGEGHNNPWVDAFFDDGWRDHDFLQGYVSVGGRLRDSAEYRAFLVDSWTPGMGSGGDGICTNETFAGFNDPGTGAWFYRTP